MNSSFSHPQYEAAPHIRDSVETQEEAQWGPGEQYMHFYCICSRGRERERGREMESERRVEIKSERGRGLEGGRDGDI